MSPRSYYAALSRVEVVVAATIAGVWVTDGVFHMGSSCSDVDARMEREPEWPAWGVP